MSEATEADPSTEPELRVAVIGTGMMGGEHIRNVGALPGATVTALVDPEPASIAGALATVADTGADPDAVATFADVEALVRADAADLVVVASPNHTHRAVLDPLWGTGLHLLIEKPLCTTVDDAQAVAAAAADHDGVVWMGLEYRFMPPVAAFVERVHAGDAGDVRMLFVREHRFPFLVKVGDWNRFTRNTGGTLVEKCCHFFDLMNLVLGERPARVLASGGQDVNHLDEVYDGEVPDIADNAFVIVDYPSGRRALLDLCMFAEGSRFEQELVATGDAGKVEVFLPGFMEVARGRSAELNVGRRADWSTTPVPLAADDRIGYQGHHHGASYLELLGLVDAVRSGAAPAVTVDDGLWSVAMGVAAHRSIDEGRPVTLAELGLDPTA